MTPLERLVEGCAWGGLGLPLWGLAAALRAAAHTDPLLARALAQRDCVYRLESRDGSWAWHLVFRGGKVAVSRSAPSQPVSTLTFLELRALSTLRPEGLLNAMIDNEVVQSGETYSLYRLGFIFDLMRRRLRRALRGATG